MLCANQNQESEYIQIGLDAVERRDEELLGHARHQQSVGTARLYTDGHSTPHTALSARSLRLRRRRERCALGGRRANAPCAAR